MTTALEARLPQLRKILEPGPTPLFATVSGAHLYGFESPDSDYDLRGAFVAPLDQVLRLRPFEETLSILEDRDDLELDWVAHDVAKFATLMTKRNGYVLEQVFSPLIVHGGPWHDELVDIARGCVTRHLHHHYAGFAKNQVALLDKGEHTVKRLLYCYRVLLTGIHVLRSGEIEAHLGHLHALYPTAGVPELMEAKRSGPERGALDASQVVEHRPALTALQRRLEQAFESSDQPDEVRSYDALDDFVLRARLALGAAGESPQ